jgi:mono/diheme cytochrome c family protein
MLSGVMREASLTAVGGQVEHAPDLLARRSSLSPEAGQKVHGALATAQKPRESGDEAKLAFSAIGRALVSVVLIGVLGVAGCASSSSERAHSGAVVFAQTCQACHSLVGSESQRKQGGDLLGYRMSRLDLTQFSREMPVRRPLTAAELRAVVDYVLRAERRPAS